MEKLKPRDIIAGILLAGAFSGKFLGYDGIMDILILGVALSYGFIVIRDIRRENKSR